MTSVDSVLTSSETQSRLDTKADAGFGAAICVADLLAAAVYTQSEVDARLNVKANAADVLPKTQTYTSSQINTLLGLFPSERHRMWMD